MVKRVEGVYKEGEGGGELGVGGLDEVALIWAV